MGDASDDVRPPPRSPEIAAGSSSSSCAGGDLVQRILSCSSSLLMSQQGSMGGLAGSLLGLRAGSQAHSLSQSQSESKEIRDAVESERMALVSELDNIPASRLVSPSTLKTLEGTGELKAYLSALFRLSDPKEEKGAARTEEAALGAIWAILNMLGGESRAKELVTLVSSQLDAMPLQTIKKLLDRVVQPLEENRASENPKGFVTCLDLWPRMLGMLAAEGGMEREQREEERSGRAMADEAVGKLCSLPWPPCCGARIAQTLLDVKMEPERRKEALERGLIQLRALTDDGQLEEVPPLVYNVLLIAGGDRAYQAASGIAQAFERLDEQQQGEPSQDSSACAKLRRAEGTVLLHFHTILNQSQALAEGLLHGFEKESIQSPPPPFRLAILLSLATLQRCRSKVMNLLCHRFHSLLAHESRSRSSYWLKMLPTCSFSGVEGHLQSVLLALVKSIRGWDHLLPIVIGLGTRFLEAEGHACEGDGKHNFRERLASSDSLRAHQRLSLVGATLLEEVFKQHAATRRELLTKAVNRIISRAPSAMAHIWLLERLCGGSLSLVLEHSSCVANAFGYIERLSPAMACALLSATAPLLQLRSEAVEKLVIPTRKAAGRPEESARLVAVRSIVTLIGHTGKRVASGSASVGEAMEVPSQSDAGGGLYLEGFGLLRRCLQQQCTVRTEVCRSLLGLCKSRCGGEAGIGEEVLTSSINLLYIHLRGFMVRAALSGDVRGAPLLLNMAIDCPGALSSLSSSATITEPLPILLGTLISLRALATDLFHLGERLQTLIDTLSKDLDALEEVTLSLPVDAWGFDAGCAFQDRREPYLCRATLAVGILEVLAQGALQKNTSGGFGASALGLLRKRQEILKMVHPSFVICGNGKGKGKSKAGGNPHSSTTAPAATTAAAAMGPGVHLQPSSPIFCLTLLPGGMPCLGLPFAEALLKELNSSSNVSRVAVDAGEDEGSRGTLDDLALQRLGISCCWWHLQDLRLGGTSLLDVEIGGGLRSGGKGLLQDERSMQADQSLAQPWSQSLVPLLVQELKRQCEATETSASALNLAAGLAVNGKTKLRSPGVSLAELAAAGLDEGVAIAVTDSDSVDVTAVKVSQLLELAFSLHASTSTPPSTVISGRAPDYHADIMNLVKSLISNGCLPEAVNLLQMQRRAVPLTAVQSPGVVQLLADDLQAFCKDTNTTSPELTKALFESYFQACQASNMRGSLELQHLKEVGDQVASVAGLVLVDDYELSQPDEIIYSCLNDRTIEAACGTLCRWMNDAMVDVNSALQILEGATPSHKDLAAVGENVTGRSGSTGSTFHPTDRMESYICCRIQAVLDATTAVIGGNIPYKCGEDMLKLIFSVHKSLLKTVKARIGAKYGWTSAGLGKLLAFRCSTFGKALDVFLTEFHKASVCHHLCVWNPS
jgi:hypothetical protein